MSEAEAEQPRPPGLLRRSLEAQGRRVLHFVSHAGASTMLTVRATVALFTTRFEPRAFIYQLEQLGVRSFGIAAATAVFVGIVMAIQFAFSLERFGARDSVGRIVGLSMVRELAPSLTSLVVGSRIAAGIAAELGSMAVTEQIDAIRALGADPVRKLVVPRVLAGTVLMPLLACFAIVLGIGSAMIVCRVTFGIQMPFFLSTAIDTIDLADLISGIGKTPVFGYLVCLLGCHFGMSTRGGTEGVGRSTTTAVVAVSIAVLVSNALLTQIFLNVLGVSG
ncbi:MAG TPA: ABC transporter permease [Sandaracinaceae bacterium LLY-WYZ-13_1]|nr:ABC transporter permease [Sandaracinaceae bacterium LLY-WYZ-13_1]